MQSLIEDLGLQECRDTVCGSEYKKPWTLKNHIKKKHGEANLSGTGQTMERFHICKVCSEVFVSKLALNDCNIFNNKHEIVIEAMQDLYANVALLIPPPPSLNTYRGWGSTPPV